MLRALLIATMLGLVCSTGNAQLLTPVENVSVPPEITEDQLGSFYRARRDFLREAIPRIIFIPGILGSKIDECQPDGTQCHSIWGTVASITDKSVDLTVKANRTYRVDIVESLFFQNIYGHFLQKLRDEIDSFEIEDNPQDPLLTVFPYDWRLSNVDNAKTLSAAICRVSAAAPDSPIVIVGHSMGGLVLKIWAHKHAATQCQNGRSPSISQLIFVATPHLGSPKTMRVFSDGYAFVFDDVNAMSDLIGYFEKNYILPSLNKSGIYFPSIYELLPIVTSEFCRSAKPKLQLLATELSSSDVPLDNVFDPSIWRSRDLLQRFAADGLRQAFYDNSLPKLLSNAEVLLCDLADFEPRSVASKVTYFVARVENGETLHSIAPGQSDSDLEYETGPGDGTVPTYSAENKLVSEAVDIMEVATDHVAVINSDRLARLIHDGPVRGWRM